MSADAANPASAHPAELLRAASAEAIRYADDAARGRVEAVLGDADEQRPDVWSLVKQNVSRTVWRRAADRTGGALYLKHFHNSSPAHRLCRRLGRGGAIREMRFSSYLLSRGVPVPKVLAVCCRGRSEWLISEGIEPATQADQWHSEQLAGGNHAAVRAATVALAELVGRMHALGVIHRDLHCGNVLVGRGSPGSVVLMDLHRMCRRRRLRRHARAANLAQLFSDRRLWTTRSQRLRFLKHYLRAADAEGTLIGWVRLIEPLAERHSRRLNANRERRIFSTNRYFAAMRVGGYRAHVVLDSKRRVPGSKASELSFAAEDWRRVLADPEALFTGEGVQVIKDSPSSLVVRRRLRVGPAEVDVHIKRPRRKHWRRWVADIFRRSRPLRAFHLGHSLLARHIYTALPLAAMEKRAGPLLVDSVLITETVAGGRPRPVEHADQGAAAAAPRNELRGLHLNRFLNRYLGSGRDDAAVPARRTNRLARQVLWQLGRLLRRLHEEGFAHRDLKATNLLVHWNGSPSQTPVVILVDLDGVRRVRRVTARQEFRGLMRLNVSLLECPAVTHAGRLRMLVGYLRRPGMGRVPFKPHWRQLQRWSSGKIRRQIISRQRRQKAQRRTSS